MGKIERRKMKAGFCMASAALAFSISAAARAQQAPAAAGQALPTSLVDQVSLDLAVHDRHNKPILDLKPDEVTVADNGKQTKLTELRLMSNDPTNEPLVTLLFDRPGMSDSKKKSDELLLGTSASSARDTSRRLRLVADRFLKGFPSHGFRFSVVDVWGRLQVQQGFGTDPKETIEAVAKAVEPEVYGSKVETNDVERRLALIAKTGQDSKGVAAEVRERTLARTMYAALKSSSRIALDQHLSPSQAALLAMVEAQEALPGRKIIVYFNSVGGRNDDPYYRPDTDRHARDALKSIIGAANRAGVNIYVVVPDELQERDQSFAMSSADAVGGVSHLGGPSIDAQSENGAINASMNYQMESSVPAASEGILTAQEDTSFLAKQTGGEVLIGLGRMAGPVKELVRNLGSYYEASYVPPAGADDGKFHTTSFNTTRKGLRLRSRTGYLAVPPNAGIGDPLQPFEVPLMALLKSGHASSDIDYRAQVIQMEHAEDGDLSLLALEVPVSGLEVRSDASTRLRSAHVSILATITDSTGTEIERFSEDIPRRWSTENSGGSVPAFISFERSFAAPPGKYVLETAIEDGNSGKGATKKQAFEVSGSGTLPELSELMVVRGVELADNLSGEEDLLWHGDRRVLPNLYGEMASSERKISVFMMAHTDPKSPVPATVKLEVLHNGTPLKGELLTRMLKAGEEISPVLTAFSIGSAVSGKYELRATLTQGDQSAMKTAEIELTGATEHVDKSGASIGAAPVAIDAPQLAAADEAADRPSQEELDRILGDARKNALDYGNALPNLMCLQTTQRYDSHGSDDWQLKDTFVEQLNYVNHKESRTLVGAKTVGEQSETSVNSNGEFGAALTNIFKPESKAKFTWKETARLRGEPAEVFEYSVEQQNSPFVLDALPVATANVAYHGRIYIDDATHWVKSLTIITDEQPKKFPIRKVVIRVDYDYVAIGDHDYLLPVSAQLITKVNGAIGDVLRRNDLAYSNFRRFRSAVRILGADAEGKAQ